MKRKALLLFSCILLSTASRAQFIVEDPGMLAETRSSWVNQFAELARQYQQLKEQTSFLRDGMEAVQKVNKKIKTSKMTLLMIDQQIETLEFLGKEATKINMSTFTDQANFGNYKNLLENMAHRTKNTSEMVLQLLADNTLNMSDFERFKKMEEISEENQQIMQAAKRAKSHYLKMDRNNSRLKKLLMGE